MTNVFDPVSLSLEENKFLLQTLGQPPVVALRALPPQVNPAAVRPVLQRVYELEELSKHEGQGWVGVAAIKAAIETYLQQAAKWLADHRRGAPRFAPLYSFDGRGRAHRGGPGSDSNTVKTYFGPGGERKLLAIELFDTPTPGWVAPTTPTEELGEGIIVNRDLQRIECFCGHVETFSNDSPSSFNMARGRLSKHLRTAKQEVEHHREIHTNLFGGADA